MRELKYFRRRSELLGQVTSTYFPSALLRSSRCSGKDREPTSLPSPGVPFPRGPGGADATGPSEFRATLPGLGARGPPCPDTTSCRARGAVRVGAVRS